MVDLRKIRGIYLYPGIADFRRGIPSLTNMILTHFKEEEAMNCLFIFFGARKKQIKMIEINEDGKWLYEKRLDRGNFILPLVGEKIQIDKRQLNKILSCIKAKKIRNND